MAATRSATDVVLLGAAARPQMIQADPAGRFVLATEFGNDRLLLWRLDVEGGHLISHASAAVPVPNGNGPRHFAFHPDGRSPYCLAERASALIVFDNDPVHCDLTFKQTDRTLVRMHEVWSGGSFPAASGLDPTGKYLYF